MRIFAFFLVLLLCCPEVHAQDNLPILHPYPLPCCAQRAVEELAAGSNILVIGEMHGTKEVPEIAATLLPSLTKRGFNVLALEAPSDQESELVSWATGNTTSVPPFYSQPGDDGRGNVQMLTLVRTALSQPFRWKLICFDETEAAAKREVDEFLRNEKLQSAQPSPSASQHNSIANIFVQRDAKMASNLLDEMKRLNLQGKVLVICGSSHARLANSDRQDNSTSLLWPSFAAVVQSERPDWKVRSMVVDLESGGYFNGGQVHAINRSIQDKAAMHSAHSNEFNLELDLQRATPATFLAPPSNPFRESAATHSHF